MARLLQKTSEEKNIRNSLKSISIKNRIIFLLAIFICAINIDVYSQINPPQQNNEELLALQYFNNGEYDKAVVLYEKLYKKNPSIYLYNYYFECLLAIQDYKKAEKLVTSLSKKNPEVFRYQVDEAIIYQKLGDLVKYEKTLRATIDNLVPNSDNYQALAQYFIFRSMDEWALKAYEKAVEKIPHDPKLRYELASMYFKNKEYTKMLEQYWYLIENQVTMLPEIQEKLQAIFAQDNTKKIINEFNSSALLRVQKSPQNKDLIELLIWGYIQNNEFEKALTQILSFDRRNKQEGVFVLEQLQPFISSKKYDLALQGLQYIIDKGEQNLNYLSALQTKLEVQYLKATSTIPADIELLKVVEQDMINLLSKLPNDNRVVPLIEKLASIQAYYLNKPNEAKKWLEIALSNQRLHPNQQALLKIQLADIMLLNGEHWDASLIYSQVEKEFKHDTIGFHAKFKNAKFFYYIGEFDYALANLKILQGSTSKLIANDAMQLYIFITSNIDSDSSYVPLEYYSKAEFKYITKDINGALNLLDSLLTSFLFHPIRDDAFYLKAKIYYEMQDYDKAIEQLNNIVEYHYHQLLADDALFMLANIYLNNKKDPIKARELFWQIVADFPSSIYAQEAREMYRKLQATNN